MTWSIWLSDGERHVTDRFPIGSTVFVAGHGLRSSTLHDFLILDEKERAVGTLLARYITDRHGNLPLTPLSPYIGLARMTMP
jgi:hypothetical protein